MNTEANIPDYNHRREIVFLIIVGFFLGAMAILNIIGITRFLQLGPLSLAVGVLPYPLTFLCTDLISEFYGRRKANQVVWVGLIVNIFVVGILWLGKSLPAVAADLQAPWQTIHLSQEVHLPSGESLNGRVELFTLLYASAAGAMVASMIAYVAAQFCDVYLFHFWKRLTKGKHLWIRNNGSTMVSQLVDSVMVISITFGAAFFRGDMTFDNIIVLLGSNYAFKLLAAAIDTLPMYAISNYLKDYLNIDPVKI